MKNKLKIRKKKLKKNPVKSLKKCPQKKGIVEKIRIVSPKKPNSARRKVAKIKLTSTNKILICKIKGYGHNLQPYSNVLVCGGRANDLPGVRYSLIKGKLDFSWEEKNQKYDRIAKRSKYGKKIENIIGN